MKSSNLKPFLRQNLDILFIGLNPAAGSSENRHYFSVNQAFWNQLYGAGLITAEVDKGEADVTVFGSNSINFNNWSYGITDLIPDIAESNSSIVNPTNKDCENLANRIKTLEPKAAILLHMKVLKFLLPYLRHEIPKSNSGRLGKLIPGYSTIFFNIAFPHGNIIKSEDKIIRYREVKEYLLETQKL